MAVLVVTAFEATALIVDFERVMVGIDPQGSFVDREPGDDAHEVERAGRA